LISRCARTSCDLSH